MIFVSTRKYFVQSSVLVENALKRLSSMHEKTLFVLDEYGKLQGSVTDSDIRRGLIDFKVIPSQTTVIEVCNKNCKKILDNNISKAVFDPRYKIYPVVKSNGIAIGVMRKPPTNMVIGQNVIGESARTFIIAEIGNNHNGSFSNAKKMIDLAVEANVDCVKFQMRDLPSLYRRKTLRGTGDDLSTEYIIDLLKKFELTKDEHFKLKEYCDEIGILYLCTPWEKASIEILESFNVLGYKVSSADLTNLPLLEILAQTSKPLILSTGMSSQEEITVSVDFLNKLGSNFALLHCNSTYPAPLKDINLKYLNSLKYIHPIIGYSGHERGISVSQAAVALGASIIERHLTLDRLMEGPDHAASLEFDEFKNLVIGIRDIEKALGSNENKAVSQGETINRENLGKSIIANKIIKKGTVLKKHHLSVKSPGQGLSPQKMAILIGKTTKRDFEEEDYFFESDINDELIQPRPYNFPQSWGIPVRYHDFATFKNICKPDLIEFHLSYSDMDLDVSDYISGEHDMDFVVHAPELFKNSHLLDLASEQEQYRKNSINEMKKIIEITLGLKKYFPKTEKPLIVTNVGGFSMDAPLEKSARMERYSILKDSLGQLDNENIELIAQTMAPFPWHFGGQRYQNLFLHKDEIFEFCSKLEINLCLDISHSYLYCNEFNEDLINFVETVSPFVKHIHFGDGEGTNGEGLQIGEGSIDFDNLIKTIKIHCANASFIPEIWQGHKNQGIGFWRALDVLEGLFNL